MSLQSRYTVLRKIADGGTAEIFLAKQNGAQGFEKMVVLKRIFTTFYADPQFRHMLVDEAHIAMSLYHSNIVQVLDLGEADGRYFMAMELVDGWTLDEVLRRSKAAQVPIPPALALYVTAEVGRALAYAHSKDRDGKPLGIVHRDISPHNVLLSEHGEVKLTDFGIAKAQTKKERSVGNIIKGKIAFMSPEQASGGEIDARSDLFSLGTILYVMVTRRYPFDAPTDYETLMQVKAGDFVAPETARPGLNPEIYRAIRKAMSRAPADRYQKAGDMLIDVEQVMRVAFRAVGQTELARWLTDLSAKDGVPPLTRAAPETEATTVMLSPGAAAARDARSAGAHADVAQESGLVLDLADAEELATLPNPAPPPIPATVVTALPYGAAPSGPVTSLRPLPFWRAPGVRRALTRTGGVLVILLLGFLSVKTLLRKSPAQAPAEPATKAATKAATKPDERVGATEAKAPIEVKPPIAPAPVTVTAQTEPKPPAAATPDAATTAPPPPVAPVAVAPAVEEGSAAEPKTKGGEANDDGDGDNDEAASDKTAAKAGTKKAAAISVLLKAEPAGTKVSTRHHTFGSTPIALKLRPGNEYELTFEKPGYQSTTKVYRVTGQTRTIAVTLKKNGKAVAPPAAHPAAPQPPPPAEANENADSKKSWWKLRFAR